MPEGNRQVLLQRRPTGMPVPEDFAIVDRPLPEPAVGEVVLRGIYLSLDPYMRGRISGVRSYARPTEIGEVIEGRVVGQVVRSRDPAFRDGEYASGGYGWQLYSAVPAGGLQKLDPEEAPISTALGILGMPGMTAYIGLGDLGAQLDRACPNGIDVYFENVGGAVQQAVFPRLNDFARMVMCGMIAEYNDTSPRPGPNLGAVIRKRIRIQGFIVSDQRQRYGEFRAMAAPLVRAGQLKYREDVIAGLEQAPAAFIGLLQGRNFGKLLVRLADDPSR